METQLTKTMTTAVVAVMLLMSCKKTGNNNPPAASTTYTPQCSGAAPSYSGNVSSLIASSCASQGCHASGSGNGPGALTTYSQVANAAQAVRTSIVNGRMPQGSNLTTEQKNSIVCWIDAGSKNN